MAPRDLNSYIRILLAAGAIILGLIGTRAWATELDLEQQRQQFLDAETALQRGDLNTFDQLASTLKQYPLYPYLEYQLLLRQLSTTKAVRVEQFLNDYADTPLAARLRGAWLRELAKRKQWWTFLVFYQPGSGKNLACLHAQALQQTGQTVAAGEAVRKLWLTGHSLPDACDPALKAWIAQGQLNDDLVWQRVGLAMAAGKTSLANYLKRFFSTFEQAAQVDSWNQVLRQPTLLLQPSQLDHVSKKSRRSLIAYQAFKKFLRSQPERATAAWPEWVKSYNLSSEQQYWGQRAILKWKMRKQLANTLSELDTFTPKVDDLSFQEQRLRYALTHSSWTQVLNWIENLPAEARKQERWRYWKARALAETGSQEAADAIFQTLALERSYHGFLAADILGTEYRMMERPLPQDAQQQARLLRWPGVQRARELFTLERMADARREWRNTTRDASRDELKQLAKLAEGWGWTNQSIFTLARSGYWDDLALRFPIQHQQQVNQKAASHQLDPAWVFALIRQESAFSSNARSSAGARGLMQLMPATAKFIAKKINHKAPARHELYQPKLNITLGTAYLKRVYSKLGQHQALATAAYNAGPHRVQSWLPDRRLDADIWIESIPFNETRRYTERILYYTSIYQSRLGLPYTRISSRTPDILPESQLAEAEPINAGSAAL